MHPCIIDALQQMTVCTLTHNLKAVNRHTGGQGGEKKRENKQTIKCKEPKIVVQKHRLHIYREC